MFSYFSHIIMIPIGFDLIMYLCGIYIFYRFIVTNHNSEASEEWTSASCDMLNRLAVGRDFFGVLPTG